MNTQANVRPHIILMGALVEVVNPKDDCHRMRAYVVARDYNDDNESVYTIGPRGYEAVLNREMPEITNEEGQVAYVEHLLEKSRCTAGYRDEDLLVIDGDKYVCADCGHSAFTMHDPCPGCGSRRIVTIDFAVQHFGADWRECFEESK